MTVLLMAALCGAGLALAGAMWFGNPVLVDAAVTIGLFAGILTTVSVMQVARSKPPKMESASIPPLQREAVAAPEALGPPESAATGEPGKVPASGDGFAAYAAVRFGEAPEAESRPGDRLIRIRRWFHEIGELRVLCLVIAGYAGVVLPLFLSLSANRHGLLATAIATAACWTGAGLAFTAAGYLAAADRVQLPEAPGLTKLARVAAWILVTAGVSIGIEWVGQQTVVRMVATVDGRQAILGRKALLQDLGVDVGPQEDAGVSQVWVAYDGRCFGRLVLRDEPRKEARDALAEMRALGISRVGWCCSRAIGLPWHGRLARRLAWIKVIDEVLPAEKLEVVRAEQAVGGTVMMVGDGVNDAPALGGADVGVAIGAELNEVALGGADAALLGTDLKRLPQLMALADITRRVMGQNVWLAFGFSVILIALAAFGVLDPLTGALSQSAAVLAVVVNSSRILRFAGRA